MLPDVFGDDPYGGRGERSDAVGQHVQDLETTSQSHPALRELDRDAEHGGQERRRQAHRPAHPPEIPASCPVHQRNERQETEHQPVHHLVRAWKQQYGFFVRQRVGSQGQPQDRRNRQYGQDPCRQPIQMMFNRFHSILTLLTYAKLTYIYVFAQFMTDIIENSVV